MLSPCSFHSFRAIIVPAAQEGQLSFRLPACAARRKKHTKEINPIMPLVIVTVFFILLFAGEGFWYLASLAEQDRQLRRYQAVEHPRRSTSDRYLDLLG